jgi:hypothetical protein
MTMALRPILLDVEFELMIAQLRTSIPSSTTARDNKPIETKQLSYTIAKLGGLGM